MSKRALLSMNMHDPLMDFVIEVDTTKAGTSASNQFTFPVTGSGINYCLSTDDGQTFTGLTASKTVTFAASGVHEVRVWGSPAHAYFNNGGDRLKLMEIKQWGRAAWSSFYAAFYGCANMLITATDIMRETVTTYYSAFRNCTSLIYIPNISIWNWSIVTSMYGLFTLSNQFKGDSLNGGGLVLDMASNADTSGMFTNVPIERLLCPNAAVGFVISTTALTGTAIDDLADSVADLAGKTGATITMSSPQKASCDNTKWTNKNWTIAT